MTCHSEGASVATEESLLSRSEILRFAQDDIFEITCSILPIPQRFVLSMLPTVSKQIRCYHSFCV
jgi:hypothetical protein